MILIKRICVVLLLWILIAYGAFIFLFNTDIGINLIFKSVTNHVTGLTFDSVSASWNGIHVAQLVYQIPDIGVIKIDKLYLSINKKYFLLKQINIEELLLKNVFVDVKKISFLKNSIRNDNKQKIKFNKFLLNKIKSIYVNDVKLYNLHLISNDTVILQWQTVNTGIKFKNNLLKISPIYITTGSVVNNFFIDLYNKTDCISNIKSMFWKKKFLTIPNTLTTLIKNKLIKVCKYNIPITFLLKEIQINELRVHNNKYDNNFGITVHHLQIQMFWSTESLALKLRANYLNGSFNSVACIMLHHNYPIFIKANYVKHNNFKNCSNKLHKIFKEIEFFISGELTDELYIYCNFIGFVSTVNIVLKVKLNHMDVPIDLLVFANKIPIFILNDSYVLEKFDFHMVGTIHNYRMTMQSKLVNAKIVNAYISMVAYGDIKKCILSKLKIDILGGSCDVRGVINWTDVIFWESVCVFNKMYIFQKYLNYSMQLSGNMNIKGWLDSKKWKIIISRINIHGNIQNNNIVCSGSMCIQSDGYWNIPMFLIDLNGSNILKIQGGLEKGRIFCVDVALNVTNCAIVSSKYTGRICGVGRFYGFIASPKLLFRLNAYSIGLKNKNINVDSVLINSSIDCFDVFQSNFLVKIKKLQFEGLLLNRLLVKGQGNLNQYVLDCIVLSKKIFGTVNINGMFSLDDQIWYNTISKTDIITPTGTWRLIQDIVFTYQHKFRKIILKAHYWENDFCGIFIPDVIKRYVLGKINIIFSNFNVEPVNNLPLRTIGIRKVRLHCTDLCWIIGHDLLPEGSVFFEEDQCKIELFDKDCIKFIVADHIITHIIMNHTELYCDWMIEINKNKNYGKFLIKRMDGVPEISGNVNINNIALISMFELLAQSKEKYCDGVLNVNIDFEGNLYFPKVYGSVQLIDYYINKPNTFFFIKNSHLNIKFLGDYAVLKGIVNTGYDGKLHLNGKFFNFNAIDDMVISVNIKGNRAHMHLSPTICLKVSPDVVCTITSKKMHIEGDLDIPWAYIETQKFSKNIIESSSEEVLLDENFQPIIDTSKKIMVMISSNLTVHFGDEVSFKGLGLYIKLIGKLKIIYNINDLALIGHVNISSGYCKTYGQDLIIKRGQLLFSGAINQTYLDIEVIRNSILNSFHINDPTVSGIRITGMVNKLKLEFCSSPLLLLQQKTVSYLLGKSNLIYVDLYDVKNMMTSLLVGASLERYEKIIDKIGNVLGIKNLTINTQNFGTSASSVFVSGYIIPGLQVKYGISILDLFTTFTIQYCLNTQLFLEFISNEYNYTIDLLYKFNF